MAISLQSMLGQQQLPRKQSSDSNRNHRQSSYKNIKASNLDARRFFDMIAQFHAQCFFVQQIFVQNCSLWIVTTREYSTSFAIMTHGEHPFRMLIQEGPSG